MNSNAAVDRLMTAEEVASYLGVATGTIYNKVSRDEIPYVKVGRAVRFRRGEIDRWTEEQAAKPGTDDAPATRSA